MSDVFCLTDKNGNLLQPAVQATALAKYSRSPESARELVSKLTAEEADKFQEKWVVSFGHNSVAELATLPLCLEKISILASKFFESWQRPGYSEKSTRYQVFSRDSFVTPPGAPAKMAQVASKLYDTYDNLYGRMVQRCAKLMGKDDVNDPKVKARAFDNLRYLLPAGTGTNVAIVANMRDFRSMITAARGHTNPEIVELGNKIYEAVATVAPTLVKHTEPDTFELPIIPYRTLVKGQSNEWNVKLYNEHLTPHPTDVFNNFECTLEDEYNMSWSVFCKHMALRPEHRGVPKIFRRVRIAFDVQMDYGAFRDLQRHRRCEQYVEPLTTSYGYMIPDDILGSELEQEYKDAMESVCYYYTGNADLDQYTVPLGYLHHSIFDMDLEEFYYIVELRTKPQGHISYRRVAYKMFELAKELHPHLVQWCRVVKPDTIGVHS